MASATFEETFAGRQWRVATEATGEREHESGTKVHYDHGRFTVDPPEADGYSTGYLIQEVDAETGQDKEGEPMLAVGEGSLRKALVEYPGCITGLPPEGIEVDAAQR